MNKRKKYILYPIIILLCFAIMYFGSELIAIYRLGLTDVYIANVSLPQRTLIVEDYLKTIKVPKAYVNEEVYLKKEEILGKYTKLDSYIPKGSMFYRDALDDPKDMKDYLHLELGENELTYDLFVKDIKVNPGHLLKGMNVDLYLTVNKKEVVSDLLISGARINGLYDNNNKEIKGNSNEESRLSTISIAVTRDMVPYLNKAIAIGEVSLFVGSNIYDSDYKMYLNSSSKIFELLS